MTFFDAIARRRVPSSVIDTVLAVLLVLGSLSTVVNTVTLPGGPGTAPLGIALAVLTGLPLVVHRRWPVPVLVVVSLAAAALQGMAYVPQPVGGHGVSIGPVYLAVAVTVFLTALRVRRSSSFALLAGVVLAASLAEIELDPGYRLSAAVTMNVLLVAAWALGELARARRAIASDIVERAAAAEREKTANARAAVAQERARIARELHDIVAHNVSLMIVQTIAADRLLDRDPGKAHELHTGVEQTGRATVVELRRLLNVLRTEEDEEPARRPPQPHIDEIPGLLAAVGDAGLRVRSTTLGAPRPLPAGTELTVYRIVQEALTNTLKHAGRTRAGVTLDWRPEELVVTVSDEGRAADAGLVATAASADGGHGLVGMRERVSAVGGRLETGPRPGGGFLVRAVVPAPLREEGCEAEEGTVRHGRNSRTARR
ncbi:sensor histidine kinase [Actinacidiphila sp. bgisy160]|uniref:sensor histidine kinase n=1 Tax=Actinacidiphila sp. bgisy160 TaxID=3413796 RepID=UPI003D753871